MTGEARPSAEAVATDFLAGHLGSPNTYAAYCRDLAGYLGYCRARGVDPLEAQRVDVAEYVRDLQTLGRSPATIARRLGTVRGFYQLAVEEYELDRSPVVGVRFRRPRRISRRQALSSAGLRDFLRAADESDDRTAGLAWLLATTGLRISEGCSALIEDFTGPADERWLDVTCKGQLRRSVPIHAGTWIRLEPVIGARSAGPVFQTRSGRAWERRAASRSLGAVADTAGIEETFSPHVLRHTFVTLARLAGCALEDVQEAAGHADPATTRGYDRSIQLHSNHPAHRILQTLEVEAGARRNAKAPR